MPKTPRARTTDESAAHQITLARRRLEEPGWVISSLDWVGGKAETLLNWLPGIFRRVLDKLGTWALRRALFFALTTINVGSRKKPSPKTHTLLTMISGALGGSLGWLTMIIELPFTTVLMLRGIADIARSEGEDLSLVEARIACLSVFGMTKGKQGEGGAQWRFFATRSAIQELLKEASKVATKRGLAARTAPVMVRLMSKIAARFGVVISEKAVAQSIPVVGILGGAAVNGLITHHYLNLARGYFTLRRLEREHGEAFVQAHYQTEPSKLKA